MKFEIYNEKNEEEKKVYLKLEKVGDTIHIIAVDELGDEYECGNLLHINSNGVIIRCTAIDPNLGFKLDENGRIKIHGVD